MSDSYLDRQPRKRSINLAVGLDDLYKGGTKKLKVGRHLAVHQVKQRVEAAVLVCTGYVEYRKLAHGRCASPFEWYAMADST